MNRLAHELLKTDPTARSFLRPDPIFLMSHAKSREVPELSPISVESSFVPD